MEKNKDIIRFKRNGGDNSILIFRGVTSEQAREWCSSPFTRKEDVYFDGFDDTNTHCINQQPKYKEYFTPDELDN